jgi:hypothetical protein
VVFLAFPLVGALIAARRPRNPIGWILLADGVLWMLSDVMDCYSIYGVARPGSVPFPLGIAGINDWLWVPAVGLLGTYMFLLFPNKRLPSTRWRPLAWLAGVVIVLVSILVGLAPGRWRTSGGTQPVRVSGTPLSDGCGVFSVAAVSSLHAPLRLSLVRRYRRSRDEERQQIKWIAQAASLVALLYLVAIVGSFVYPQETRFAPGSPLWLNLLEYTIRSTRSVGRP